MSVILTSIAGGTNLVNRQLRPHAAQSLLCCAAERTSVTHNEGNKAGQSDYIG